MATIDTIEASEVEAAFLLSADAFRQTLHGPEHDDNLAFEALTQYFTMCDIAQGRREIDGKSCGLWSLFIEGLVTIGELEAEAEKLADALEGPDVFFEDPTLAHSYDSSGKPNKKAGIIDPAEFVQKVLDS